MTTLEKIKTGKKERMQTGIHELDRVLGGGFVPGEVVFLSGEPGVGKSTLLLQALRNLSTIYVSGEESGTQVRDRAARLELQLSHISFSETTQVEGIVEGIKALARKPDLLVIDSIQTVYCSSVESPPGSINQLKESASRLIDMAKQTGIVIIIVGHITKDGDIAGPKTLEHVVDCVITFEGDNASNFRILRSSKNRFGATDEVGIFEMGEKGLAEVTDPLAFIKDVSLPQPGKSVVGILEGRRPLFLEVQTLAVPTSLSMPRRVVKGVDYNKVQLLMAVMKKHLSIQLDGYDIYVNVIGGVRITSPLADLGIIASLYSSIKNIPVPQKTLFVGEVGLLGEVRPFPAEEKITKEAKRLKFKLLYTPHTVRAISQIRNLILSG